MSKIRLDLDALQVESFDTTGGEKRARGTVQGNMAPETYYRYCGTDYGSCFESDCGGCTDFDSCFGSCDASCMNGTCGENTCQASCNGTCNSCAGQYTCGDASCYGTCGEYTCDYTCDTCLKYCNTGPYYACL
ncbi:MAG TPA: hypothetical protein VF746_24575 [Longimicrobium sp.]|jgi:hypothetical protein